MDASHPRAFASHRPTTTAAWRLRVILETHRARLREAFGNTLSDEFVEFLLGNLMEALRPNPFDKLEEPTLNAALAFIHSNQPRSEMEALIAVEIVATGLSGLRFLRQSQHHMSEDFIDVYGSFSIKLLKLQNELLQALDRIGGAATKPSRSTTFTFIRAAKG